MMSGYSDEDFLRIVTAWIRPFLSRLNRDHLPDKCQIFTGDEVTSEAAADLGPDLVMQALWASRMDLTEELKQRRGTSKAGAFSLLFNNSQSTSMALPNKTVYALETQEVDKDIFADEEDLDDAVKSVPETMALDQGCKSPVFNNSDDKDPDLDPSPSILAYHNRAKSESKVKVDKLVSDEEDDLDDFDFVRPEPKRRKHHVKVTNKFGVEVTKTSNSQMERNANLKQGNIKNFMAKKGNHKKPESDLEKAKKLSLAEFRNEQKKATDDEPDYKYNAGTVRGKKARRQLEAFSCEECREFFEGCENPERFMKNCSKHRAKFKPSDKESPKKIWRMEIESPEKTQWEPRGKSLLDMDMNKRKRNE